MSFLGPRVEIAESAYIAPNVYLFGEVIIEDNVIIEDGCMVGRPSDEQFKKIHDETPRRISYEIYDAFVDTKTTIKDSCHIGRNSTIHSGSLLNDSVLLKENIVVGWDSTIGKNSKLMYNSQIHSWVSIGDNCRIGGFCCNDAKVGNYVSLFGNLLHAYRKYGGGRRDPAPTIKNKVIVGFGAQIIGDVTIGDNSYIAANSIVTKDVDPSSVVILLNEQYYIHDWPHRLNPNYVDLR